MDGQGADLSAAFDIAVRKPVNKSSSIRKKFQNPHMTFSCIDYHVSPKSKWYHSSGKEGLLWTG